MYGTKCIAFGQIFEKKILIDLHVLLFRESEISHFKLLICLLCVYASDICATQKQIVLGTPNLIFYIYTICRCYWKHYVKVGQITCSQTRIKEFKYFTSCKGNFLLMCFNIFEPH